MNKDISESLDDDVLAALDEFLLERMDDETGDRIAAVGGGDRRVSRDYVFPD